NSGNLRLNGNGNNSVSAGRIFGAGNLTITNGSLSLTDSQNPSQVTTLTQSGGTLTGAATLNVATTFNWSGGTQSGTGTTDLGPAGTGTDTSCSTCSGGNLDTRTLRIEGSFAHAAGAGYMTGSNGATIEIASGGTFTENSESSWTGWTLQSVGGA